MDGDAPVLGSQLLKARGLIDRPFPYPSALLPAVPPPALAVIDANAVLRAAVAKTRQRSPNYLVGIEELHEAGLLVLVAPPRLLSEVARNAGDFQVDRAALDQAIDSVLARVVILETSHQFHSPSATAMAARDPDDTDYACLFDLARADWVLSNDDDWDCCVGVPRFRADGRDELLRLRDACRALARVRGTYLTAAIGLTAGWAAASSTLGLVILAAAATALLLSPTLRQRAGDALGDPADRLRPMFVEFAEEFGDSQALLRGQGRTILDEMVRQLRPLALGDRLFRLCLMNGEVALTNVANALQLGGLGDGPITPHAVIGATARDRRIVASGGKLRTQRSLGQRSAQAAWRELER